MSSTTNLGLANGFAQGFGLMDRHYTNKQARELREKQDARSEQTFQNQQADYQRQGDARLVEAVRQGMEAENLDPKLAQEYSERFGVDWSNYTKPEFGQALETLKGALEGKVQRNSPEFNKAADLVLRSEINRNVGEEIEGEKGVSRIKAKHFKGMYPSPSGKGMMINLDVIEEGPDGEVRREAPVTAPNRSAKDTEVMEIPIEKLIDKLQGHDMMYKAVQNSPKLQALFNQHAALSGGSIPKAEKRYSDLEEHPGLGTIQRGPNGEVKVLKGLADADEYSNQVVINGQLVDRDTGKPIGDFRDSDKPAKPISVNGQLVDPTTYTVLGDFRDEDDKSGGGSSDGTGGLDKTVIGQIQQTAKTFHGSFNPDGSFLGIPEAARKSYTEAMHRSQQLVQSGLGVFEATKIANLSTIPPLTLDSATKLAEKEADEKDLSGRGYDKFMKTRPQELIQEQGKALAEYERIVNGQSNSPAPTGLGSVPSGQSGKIQRALVKEPAPKSAPPKPKKVAPQAAIDRLMAEPHLKQQFLDYYGYLPEGI